jgi:hypothetical protein
MQTVLSGLRSDKGKEFVNVYIDDTLVFSETMEEHLCHLRQVLKRIVAAKLKLKPAKYHFLCESVEYLGNVITPHGLQPNPKQVEAVLKFPVPSSAISVGHFLGITSYYQRFISQIASPLHA